MASMRHQHLVRDSFIKTHVLRKLNETVRLIHVILFYCISAMYTLSFIQGRMLRRVLLNEEEDPICRMILKHVKKGHSRINLQVAYMDGE